jgi:hypothetical protein
LDWGVSDRVQHNGNANTAGMAMYFVKSNVVVMIAMQPSSSSTAIEKLARTAVGRI